MRKPEFLTITGVDESTNLSRARSIAERWPVEFAVLLSERWAGRSNRYPPLWFVQRAITTLPRVAVHLCGKLAVDVCSPAELLPSYVCRLLNGRIGRLQVNSTDVYPLRVQSAASRVGARGVGQWRDAGAFPTNTEIDWLFDRSGGRGIPLGDHQIAHSYDPDRLVGYAGGIGPKNIFDTIQQINSQVPYWLDMETAVRTREWLDLDKVTRVCEAVYG